MAWENVEERLKKPFKVEVSFPAGTVWLPEQHVTIDNWLSSIAVTDEELTELNIPRIRFIQNHWNIEKLLDMKWDNDFSNKCAVWAMYVGHRAYILFSDRFQYRLVAAIEPRNEPSLYRAVIGKMLQNPVFIPKLPRTVNNCRPDLVPDIFEDAVESRAHDDVHQESSLSRLLVGWIGSWIDLPVLGFFHEDEPDSITTSEKGTYVMKYKPTYGDKQRDAQKHKKEEEVHNQQLQPEPAKKQETGQSEGKDKQQPGPGTRNAA